MTAPSPQGAEKELLGLARRLYAYWAGSLLLFTAIVAMALVAASNGSLQGTVLLAGVAAFIAARVIRSWPAVLDARATELLARAKEADSSKELDLALRLARAAWASALPRTRPQADSLAWMAWVLIQKKRGVEALRVLACVPEGFIPPTATRAQAYLLTGESALALSLMEQEYASNPDSHVAHMRVSALLQLQRLDEALALLSGPVGEKVCLDAFHEAQRAALDAGRPQEALSLGEQGFARQPHPLGAWLLSRTLEKLGRPEEAATWLKRAVDAGFTDPEAQKTEKSRETTSSANGPEEALFDPDPWERPSPAQLITRWMLVTVAGLVVASLAIELPLLLLFGVSSSGSPALLVSVIQGALTGGVLGLAQWLILRRVLPGAALWIVATAIGSVLGQVAMHQVIPEVTTLQGLTYSTFGTVLFFIGIREALAACFQAIVLGRWFPRVSIWPLAVFVAGFVAELAANHLWGALLRLQGGASSSPTPSTFIVHTLLNSGFQGLFIGAAGGWLIQGFLAVRHRELPPPPVSFFSSEVTPVRAALRRSPFEKTPLPATLPLFALRDTVLFPGGVLPVAVGRWKSVEAVKAALESNSLIVVAAQRDAELEDPSPADLPRIAVIAQVFRVQKAGSGFQISFHGLARVRLEEFLSTESHLRVRVTLVEEPHPRDAQGSLDVLRRQCHAYLRGLPRVEPRLGAVLTIADPRDLADLMAANLKASVAEKQAILEDTDMDSRAQRVLRLVDPAKQTQLTPTPG